MAEDGKLGLFFLDLEATPLSFFLSTLIEPSAETQGGGEEKRERNGPSILTLDTERGVLCLCSAFQDKEEEGEETGGGGSQIFWEKTRPKRPRTRVKRATAHENGNPDLICRS